MLTEERFAKILALLKEKNTVSVAELTELLESSESTVRRDLNSLHEMGKLRKIHGGAMALSQNLSTYEADVPTKARLHVEEKDRIAKYAASVVHDDDFVFIDAGTTTERMIDYLSDTRATFVTNGVNHARKLIQKGLRAYIIGGELKLITEAVVGAEAVSNLRKYNFTKCFMGTNGIDLDAGFSTPDVEEAQVKTEVIRRSFVSYVLADDTKFGVVSAVTYAEIGQACIVTNKAPDTKYRENAVIKVTNDLSYSQEKGRKP